MKQEEEEEEEEDVHYTVHASAAVSGGLDKQHTPLGPGRAPAPGPHAPRAGGGAPPQGRTRRRTGQSPMCDRTCPSFLENVQVSPRKTPSKGLPFSPSRVSRAAVALVLFICRAS